MGMRDFPETVEEHIAYIYEQLRSLRPLNPDAHKILSLTHSDTLLEEAPPEHGQVLIWNEIEGGWEPGNAQSHTHDDVPALTTIVGGLNETNPGQARAFDTRSFVGGDFASSYAPDSLVIGVGVDYGPVLPDDTISYAAYIGPEGEWSVAIGPTSGDAFGSGPRVTSFNTIAIGTFAGEIYGGVSGEAIYIGGYCYAIESDPADTGGQHVLVGPYANVDEKVFFTTIVGNGAYSGSFASSQLGEGSFVGLNSDAAGSFGSGAEVSDDSPSALAGGDGAFAEGIAALAWGGGGQFGGAARALADRAIAIGGSDDTNQCEAAFVESLAMLRACQTQFDFHAKIGTLHTIFEVSGGLRVFPKVVDNFDYTIASRGTDVDKETVVLVESNSGARTVTLPPIDTEEVGRVVVVKKIKFPGNTHNNVTVAADTGTPDLIDGAATKVLTADYEQVRLVASYVGEWSVI